MLVAIVAAVTSHALSDAEVAIAAASAGAAEVRARYGQPVERFAKQGTDFATSADLASEAAIRAVVTAHRPEDAMIGEEDGRSGPDDAAREWLVDPLCGTRNFAATTPLVAVNVALEAEYGLARRRECGPGHRRGVLDGRLAPPGYAATGPTPRSCPAPRPCSSTSTWTTSAEARASTSCRTRRSCATTSRGSAPRPSP